VEAGSGDGDTAVAFSGADKGADRGAAMGVEGRRAVEVE